MRRSDGSREIGGCLMMLLAIAVAGCGPSQLPAEERKPASAPAAAKESAVEQQLPDERRNDQQRRPGRRLTDGCENKHTFHRVYSSPFAF